MREKLIVCVLRAVEEGLQTAEVIASAIGHPQKSVSATLSDLAADGVIECFDTERHGRRGPRLRHYRPAVRAVSRS